MKQNRLLFFLITLFSCLTLFAQDDTEAELQRKGEDPDMDALRKWIRDKRLVTIKETGGDLSYSGDIRTAFTAYNEKVGKRRQRGHNAATDLPAREYRQIFNFLLDYRTERTWASVKIGYNNEMGVVSGTKDKISLGKAFFGGRLIAGDTFIWDGELGRRILGSVFDSRVQFRSLMDGLLFRFNKAFETVGDFYVNPGIFIINNRRDEYAYASEIGLLNIGNTGLLMKASYIWWKKYNVNNEIENQLFNFRISQLLMGYQFTPESWPKLIKFYAAGLYNDAANTLDKTVIVFPPNSNNPDRNKKLNWAWYVGVSIGQARKKGDWAIDTNYQWVQGQAVPEFDAAGIGRCNSAEVGFYTAANKDPTPNPINNVRGNTNYHGWVIDVLYAFTNNITLKQKFELSYRLNKSVGPNLRCKKLQMEFIFAF